MGENRPHSEDEEVRKILHSAAPDDRCKNRYNRDSATETDTSLLRLMLAREPATKLTDTLSNGSKPSDYVEYDLFYSLFCTVICIGSFFSRSSRFFQGHRIFRARATITNELVKVDHHFQAVHDAFMVQLLLLLVFIVFRDTYITGRIHLDMTFFKAGFGSQDELLLFALYEAFLLSCALSLHPLLKIWSSLRRFSKPVIDSVFIVMYAVFVCGTLVGTVGFVSAHQLPRILSLILGVEQVRICMKSYSFIRENAYKVLYPWHKDDKSGPAVWYAGQMSPTVGSFYQYLYYLFSPTLLYRDHYPRFSGSIRWKTVLIYFAQFMVTLWSSVFIVQEVLIPQSLSSHDLVKSFMLCVLATFVVALIGHTCILHAWMNMWAEITQFADREFFSDWWTCTSYSSYFRKWNLLVHDWIHAYMYMDMKKKFGPIAAMIVTIIVSSVVHEYLLFTGVWFLLPILSAEFAGTGIIFYFVKPFGGRRLSNLFILFTFSIGSGIMIFILLTEFAARLYCPIKSPGLMDMIIPRMLECYSQFN